MDLLNATLPSTKELASQAFSAILPSLQPIFTLLFSLAGIYILYLIIKAFLAYRTNKRIIEMDEKLDEVLEILNRKKSK